MNIKTAAICLYIVGVYGVATKFPTLHSLFFPTLGAFSLLFINRPFSIMQLSKVALGAIIASLIGTVIVYVHAGVIPLLINMVIVIWLINRFKLNAPPILAVSFVPFFVQPSFIWAIPISVFGSLIGLLLTLLLAHQVETKWTVLPAFLKTNTESKSDTAA
ncbi:hypothetical protein Back11_49170 [Paenibacillus baekrokdamisoli]|uniref:Uncharacterized protein n=1 Tax=Paenibacillus baekrokdamisoli TaxID=1712516 RepID=A0A3G9IZ69_9BACL|nr:hypothetical protein [Paenibacillus baekrokdamisoli]MBB3068741.1 hypothetical protein [Paenibacillus baekrokdamisoli]BBH23572.1 hypothetical protein Back11_49170 [Paenibacillus baekrokdamisoli]